MKIGLLGAAWFGRTAHLENLVRIDGLTPTAVSSRSEASLHASQAIVGSDLETFTNWRDVLQVEEIDAVIIALPNHEHHAACLAAFEAGKHVLCEKPLGLTLHECNEIIAASSAAGKILQIGHEMRFQRLYQQAKAMIDGGSIGELELMWCREFRGPMRTGWRSQETLTGGMILEKNCHHLDLFNWMIGQPPIRVAAMGGRNVLLDREVLDNAQVLIEYEGGKRATLEVCLFAPQGGDCELGAVGDLGRIDTMNQALSLVHHRFDTKEHEEMRIPESDEEAHFVDSSGRVDRGIRPELEHFLESCQTGRQPLTDGASARMSVAVCLAAQESIRRHEFVELSEILDGSSPNASE